MQIGSIVFEPVGSIPDEVITFAVIAARHKGQWLYVRHKARTTWEIPGGHREAGETGLASAQRELHEETGAADFSITPVCIYGVAQDGKTTYGLLCIADVRTLGPLDPEMEIAEVMRHPALPDNLTYPSIQPALYDHVEAWLNLHSAPDTL